jgi:hypothetical protein
VDPATNAPAARRNYHAPTWDTPVPIRLELQPTTGANPTVAAGSGGAPFVVSLPPATILDVPYVSTMHESDLDLMWCWNNRDPSVPYTAAQAAHGEVTQLTPSRRFRMVHAVKKPLAAASLTSATLQKLPGWTFSSITAGALSAHSRSTGEIEVWAEWTETQDLLPNPPQIGVPRKAFAYRISIPYDSNSVTFPVVPQHQVASVDECDLPKGAPNARIDFGDTKYRSIKFRCTASTRYAEYYNPADVADPTQTTLPGDLTTTAYTVFNSATGPVPDVAYVVPTFNWDTTSGTTHTRTGSSVRIYLNRPWFQTGDGELLGVLVANVASGAVDVDDTVRPYVSEMGYDPVYGDTFSNVLFGNLAFTTLTASRVVSAAAQTAQGGTSMQVVPAELAGTWPKPPAPPLPAPPLPVIAVGHTVQYSKERDLWFTDVELDIGAAYSPMVRLAVARFQPNSIGGARLEVSKVVRIDCIQLAASRTASISRPMTGAPLVVTVSGPSATNAYGVTQGGGAGGGHEVIATIETRTPGQTEFDWIKGASVTLTPMPMSGNTMSWSGSIPGVDKTSSTTEVRVRIEESELFNANPDTTPGSPIGKRPVFVDTFLVTV